VTELTLEDLTPSACDAMLKTVFNAVSVAQRELREARTVEVNARRTYKRASVKATLSPAAPKVTRGGYTTAERDAWVDDKVDAEEFAYDQAKAARESAEDYIRSLRDQGVLVATLAKSVQQAYGMAGRAL
jgi:hypothetical protein